MQRLTLVPEAKLVRSSVVPAGTAMLFKVMVLQDALDFATLAASVKVQDALSASWERGAASPAGAA